MLFQVIDKKNKCPEIFYDGKILKFENHDELTRTWSYTSHLKKAKVECASLYCGGKTPDEVCPDYIRQEWTEVSKKMKSFLKSFIAAKISLDEFCMFNMIPEKFLLEFFHVKNKITDHVLETYQKPDNYDFLYNLNRVLTSISDKRLNIDEKALENLFETYGAHRKLSRLSESGNRVVYNLFGTKTGRLTTRPSSFPILTLKSNYKELILPNNDWFLELDFNSAELRTLLSLAGHEQPKEDIHMWNKENIFKDDSLSRQEAKTKIFAWLYNSTNQMPEAEKIYDRKKIKNEYFDGSNVKTPFGRKIQADNHHSLSYIIQSTTADLLLRQMIKIHDLLKDKKSYVAFCVHDSIVIDLSMEDRSSLEDLVSLFADTDLGKFKVNASVGDNYGGLRKLNV